MAYSKQKALVLGIEIKDNPVLGLMDCFVETIINVTVSGIKATVSCHFEIFIRDMLDKQFDKVNDRKRFPYESIIFVLVAMKSNVIAIVGIDSGEGETGCSR